MDGTTMRKAATQVDPDPDEADDGSFGKEQNLRAQHSNMSLGSGTSQIPTSRTREEEYRLDDDLTMLQAERAVTGPIDLAQPSPSLGRTRSRRTDPVDEFDINTNPVHEKAAAYRVPDHPTSKLAKIFKKIHSSSFLVRYFMYIIPVAALLSVPLLIGALVYKNDNKGVGGVQLLWFSVWLEILWLTLWAGRIAAKMIPWPLGLLTSLWTNNSKKWRDMGKQLELPITLFFWCLGLEVSFLPTMTSHKIPGYTGDTSWMTTVNQIIISVFVGAILNLIEKVIIQLIAISFHLRTYSDRIEISKFQIASLVKLYDFSKKKIAMEDSDFEDNQPLSGSGSGTRTPMQYVEKARRDFTSGFRKVGDVAGKVAGDFTGKQVTKSTHPHQVVLLLLSSTQGSQVLARRLYRTFIQEDADTISSEDIKPAFEKDDEAEAAFSMFDKDLNGDISMEELESVCVEVGRERKSITASLKDLDSVVSKLDAVLVFIVVCVTVLVFITLISTSAAGVLTSAGSTVLALSWLFSATAQEFLQSLIFVFVKHPFDIGDRVSIYGNTGTSLKGDDYFVKEISLLYTEFKKMEGHVVQAPNSYLNQLFILNQRRSGPLAEAVPLTVKFGTTLEQIDGLRNRLLEFVRAEKREYQGNILTEIHDVVEVHSVNLNVVFFYKSNWQNEGLRLQRRNKFICTLMLAMQELAIEGPLMRLPGQKSGRPFYVQYPVQEPVGLNLPHSGHHGSLPDPLSHEQTSISDLKDRSALQHGPPTLRHPSRSRTRRPRADSVSSLAKRVDFSLGMKDIAPGDILGDVYEERPRTRVPELLRPAASRGHQATAIVEEDDDESHSTAREGSTARSRFTRKRSSAGSQTGTRPSIAGTIHRNRFFGRAGREREADSAYESLMERGMAAIQESNGQSGSIDPRSGMISPQAVRLDSHSNEDGSRVSDRYGGSNSDQAKEIFEMSRMG